MLRRRGQPGDTLIEVLFAITTFSLVVVTCLAIMNQGASASIRSLQITNVRQEIDSQAETLRFLNSSYVSNYFSGYAPDTHDSATSPAEEYYKIIQNTGTNAVSAFSDNSSTDCPAIPNSSFVVNTRLARFEVYEAQKMVPAEVFSEVIYQPSTGLVDESRGLWIEAVRSPENPGRPRYIDFHIRACWSSPGSNRPTNLGTIVRLYEPAA